MPTSMLQRLAQFTRPTPLGEFEVYSYFASGTFTFAVARGALPSDGLLVRIQSPCLFGESFLVNSCDCGEQLRMALERGSKEDSFLLVYPGDQEGRGLGMFQKIRAVEAEVKHDVDMAEAFRLLGLPMDLRSYATVAEIIKELNGTRPIRLMTNNPKKISGLEKHGIHVAERVPLVVESPNAACRRYLRSKKREMGHLLPDFE